MKTSTRIYNNVAVVELQGELDSNSTGLFQNIIRDIIAGREADIVIDMSGIKFVDSDGLSRLLWARDYCNDNNRQLRLTGFDENCEKILEITRLKNEFDHYRGLPEAIKSFA